MNVVENMRANRILEMAEDGGYFAALDTMLEDIERERLTEPQDKEQRDWVLHKAGEMARALLDPVYPGIEVTAKRRTWKNAKYRFHFTLIGGSQKGA